MGQVLPVLAVWGKEFGFYSKETWEGFQQRNDIEFAFQEDKIYLSESTIFKLP